MDGDARCRARRSAPDHLSLYALTLDDPDAEGLTGAGRRPPADDGRRPALARAAHARRRTRIGPRPSTTTPSIASRAAGWRGYEIRTGRGPATRAATTSRTGSAGRTRRSGPGAHAFDGVTRRWNAARLDGYVGALTPADGRAEPAARRRGGHRRGTTAAAEAVILGLRMDRACRSRRPTSRRSRTSSAGRSPPNSSTSRRRPGRPHDPRPAALERAVPPPRRRPLNAHAAELAR